MRNAQAVPSYITLVWCQESWVKTVVVILVICTADRLFFGEWNVRAGEQPAEEIPFGRPNHRFLKE